MAASAPLQGRSPAQRRPSSPRGALFYWQAVLIKLAGCPRRPKFPCPSRTSRVSILELSLGAAETLTHEMLAIRDPPAGLHTLGLPTVPHSVPPGLGPLYVSSSPRFHAQPGGQAEGGVGGIASSLGAWVMGGGGVYCWLWYDLVSNLKVVDNWVQWRSCSCGGTPRSLVSSWAAPPPRSCSCNLPAST
jgi:hypothetical protein